MTRAARCALLVALLPTIAPPASAYDPVLARRLEDVVQPYADSGAFAGAILVVRDGEVLLDKAYGMANVEAGIANRPSTSFHVGTLSMQYTAVAIVHLVETHHLAFDNTADQFVPGAPVITVRDLLAVAPDAPDANAKYELLAQIAAATMGTSFPDVEGAAAFGSVWMSGSGIDDGTPSSESRMAHGYVRDSGASKPVEPEWRPLMGAASAFTTTRDELHWLDRFFAGDLVSPDDRLAVTATHAGYGWFRGPPLPSDAFWMAGQAPGFASYVLREGNLTVIVLANIDQAPTAMIGNALAAGVLVRGHPPI